MNDKLLQDSLSIAENSIKQTSENPDSINIWLWIALGEFAIIVALLYSLKLKRKRNAKQRFKDESLAQEIDFNNIINSSFHSTKLYNVLKVKCHPDRFPTDSKLNTIADNLFQEITKNKTNLKRLEELKIEAQKKLNINF